MLSMHTQFDFASRVKSKSKSEEKSVFEFLHSREIICFDRCLSMGMDINTKDQSWLACDYTALHYLAGEQEKNTDKDTDLAAVMYLLTSEPKMKINAKNAIGRTAISLAAWYNRVDFLKLLIDFNGDRDLVDNSNQTPLYWAKIAKCKEAEEILTGYFPKEDEKLHSQMEAKLQVEKFFSKNALSKRFGYKLVDLKYSSIQAIYTGNFNLLKKSMPLIDNAMLLSLTTLAAKEDQVHLLVYLCEKYRSSKMIREGYDGEIEKVTGSQFKPSYGVFERFDGDGEEKESSSSTFAVNKCATNVLNVRDEDGYSILDLLDCEAKSTSSQSTTNYDAMETFLLCGMDPIPHNRRARSSRTLERIIDRSRVLAVFKILYHKYIFLDILSIFSLVQTLMIEFDRTI